MDKKREIKIYADIVDLDLDIAKFEEKIDKANELKEVINEITEITLYKHQFEKAEKEFDRQVQKLKDELYIKKQEILRASKKIEDKAKKEFEDKAKYKEITKRIVNDETGEVHFIKTLKLTNHPLPKGFIYRKGRETFVPLDESKLDESLFKKVLKKKNFNEAIKRGEIDPSLYEIKKGEPSISIDAWKLENE